jgi:hypothetical protein
MTPLEIFEKMVNAHGINIIDRNNDVITLKSPILTFKAKFIESTRSPDINEAYEVLSKRNVKESLFAIIYSNLHILDRFNDRESVEIANKNIDIYWVCGYTGPLSKFVQIDLAELTRGGIYDH